MEENSPHLEDTFYILATEATADYVTRVLKDGDSFAVFDPHGDIQPTGLGQEGIYHEGTRFLSRLELKLGNGRPFLLDSAVQEDNLLFVVHLTNPDVYRNGQLLLPRGTLHITRTKLLRQATCFETLRFINYGLTPVEVRFSMEFDADFADLFEVRGMTRERRGTRSETTIAVDQLQFAYLGLDGVARRTRIRCNPAPSQLTVSKAMFVVLLGPKEEREFNLDYGCEIGGAPSRIVNHGRAYVEAIESMRALQRRACCVRTSNDTFNRWLARSSSDLHMMITSTPCGFYPYAGVPWFSTPFGRDGIITALEYLWVNPEIARGVLTFLAAHQAQQHDPDRDAEPGKILHETRKGEMAALREIPFDCYYGSIDATPLFVMLAGTYLNWTGDLEFIKSIWPQISLALRWIDQHGDRDEDGFLEYARYSPKGLIQQGWKDSWDSVFHSDGHLAEGPIALCEVQGYAYAARIAGAAIAAALGLKNEAEIFTRRAENLKGIFQEHFWCEAISSYALALDGAKQQCQVRTSNAGHCLFTGIAGSEQAGHIAATLMQEDSFSGWGVRTLALCEARFNPMAYHNGSIWPHDNALIAAGLARYGYKDEARRILGGLFDASLFVEYRLPELFCGFYRRDGEGPIPYPLACSPQAWSAASVFLLLQAILGLEIDAGAARLSLTHPLLPDFLDEIKIEDLRVGAASVDVLIHRVAHRVAVEIERSDGPIELQVEGLDSPR
ncbi:MAG TPA: amylo-alpha-1,6-glucosidase [Candidatus Binatia bacterium]|nr:amylo-alpha-1,6-glucosidase [Candidatus Binatia bacterium]